VIACKSFGVPAIPAEGPSLLVSSLADEDAAAEDVDHAPIRPRKRKQVVEESSEEDLTAEVPLKKTVTGIPPVTTTSKKKVTHKPAPVAGTEKKKKRDLASLRLNLGQDAHLFKRLRRDRREVPKGAVASSVDDVIGDNPPTSTTTSIPASPSQPASTTSETIVAGSAQATPSADAPSKEKTADISPGSSSSNNLFHTTLRIGDTVYDLSSDENTVEEVHRLREAPREVCRQWVVGHMVASLAVVADFLHPADVEFVSMKRDNKALTEKVLKLEAETARWKAVAE